VTDRYDAIVRNGVVLDGLGSAPRRADVGIRDGRIVEIGKISEEANEVIDADGLVVTPGFVDPHTHYDAQLFWDPAATPSNLHGVTSMIAGNCGFTLAPVEAEDADYLRRMMAKVEGMPLPALETGVPWSWHSFGEYLDAVDARVGLNVGFLVGHCAIRRNVMGADAIGNEATPEQLAAMVRLLEDSIAAGGLGFSTTLSFTHSDGDGQPVASRWASNDEVLALCRAVSEHEGTSVEYVTDGCLRGFSDEAQGRYAITLSAGEIGNSADGAEAMEANGEGRSGVINSNDDADWFAINLVEGRPYRFNVQRTDSDSIGDPVLSSNS
jgi:N-acyl-D-aspartate/D-glutamate deacylase